MPGSKLRIILDTNIWISILLKKEFEQFDKLFDRNYVDILYSKELISEFIDVASRPKFHKFFDSFDIERVIELFVEHGYLVNVIAKVQICRDIKDNFILDLAEQGNADFLITGDKDLLIIEEFYNTKIVTISEFSVIFPRKNKL